MKAYNLQTAIAHREEVTELYLHNCRLEFLPPVVFGMPLLRKLEITANQVREIPPQIRELKKLRSLSLYFNQIEEIPPQLFELQQLTELHLGNNRIKVLPPAIGKLKNLQQLCIGGNALEALPPEIGQLRQLRLLELHQNQLERLPPEIGSLAALRQLRAAGNRIGRLPAALFKLRQLDALDLSHNRIGALPENIGQLQQLSTLNLAHNQLRALPQAIGRLLVLRRLILAGNKIAAIPESISRLPWLAHLNLEKNKLQSLPESIGQIQRLDTLVLNNNQLSALPASLAQMNALRQLLLDGNRLSLLPPLPGSLARLAISRNQLTVLPEGIQQLHNLQVLEAEKNQLSTLPDNFRRLHRLQKLLLGGNPMPDLPQALFFLPALETLQGPGNQHSRRKLLRFLQLCRSREVPGRLRLAIYDVMEEEGRRLSEFSTPLLLEALSVGMSDVAYAIRKHLLEERSEVQDIQPPCEGKKIGLLGETGFEPQRLRPQLEKLGMQLTEDPEAAADYLVVGRLLRAMQLKVPQNYRHLISRRSLAHFLNQALGRKFALDPTPQQLSNLRHMIFSPQPAQRALALQLFRANGLPRQLLTDVFMAWKLGYGEAAALEKLLLQNTSEEALRAMYYPLGLTGRTSEATLATNIVKYTEDNEFDGRRIAQFLNELYGTARLYLKRYG